MKLPPLYCYNKLIRAFNRNDCRGNLESFGLRDDHELAYLWQTFFSLQKIDEEEEKEQCLHKPKMAKKCKGKGSNKRRPSSSISHRGRDVETDDELEQTDPTPDIDMLMQKLNKKYLRGKLPPILLRWSNRLTYTAGYTKFDGKTACIVLSAPLLSLRSRKDLIDTLLHEMIHALLFYQGKIDHIDHGPSFVRWMKRVNLRAGTRITPYHSYHEEVDFLRQHWWRCNGPCTLRAPYFGLVRRAVDRAPSQQDRWWPRHARQCGGAFSKVRSAVNAGGCPQVWTRRLLKKRVPRIRFKKTLRVYTIPARKQKQKRARKRNRRVSRGR